jgi:uncharacterized protein YceK
MKKIAILLLVLMISLAGCGTTNTDETSGSATETSKSEETTSSQVEPSSSSSSDKQKSSTEDADTEEESKAIEVIGTYEGEADSHTIEVIADTPLALQYPEELSEKILQFNEGEKVFVVYEENEVGQLQLIEIEKAD